MMSMTASHEGLRLLHVHAHPDDESSKGAATTAYYRARGVRVLVATCTGGERGDILNPKMDNEENQSRLVELRREEMARAAMILDIEQTWLGFVDSGMGPQVDPDAFAAQDVEQAAGRLVKVIREFRPHVVTTYAEDGGYPHPDHIMTHKITMDAVEAASSPTAWPELGPIWLVGKVYYDITLHRERFLKLARAMQEAGLESPYGTDLTRDAEPKHARITTRIPCSEYFQTRDDALRAHATQVDPDGRWFAVPLDIQRSAYPTEDYQLVRSRVQVDLPESDLFAGITIGQTDQWKDWVFPG